MWVGTAYVPYFWPYFLQIFPYIGLIYGGYLQFWFLKWPSKRCDGCDLSRKTWDFTGGCFCISINGGFQWEKEVYSGNVSLVLNDVEVLFNKEIISNGGTIVEKEEDLRGKLTSSSVMENSDEYCA